MGITLGNELHAASPRHDQITCTRPACLIFIKLVKLSKAIAFNAIISTQTWMLSDLTGFIVHVIHRFPFR